MKVLLQGTLDLSSYDGRWLSGLAATLDYMGADVHFKAPVQVYPPITRGMAFILAKTPLSHYDLEITQYKNSLPQLADKTIWLGYSPLTSFASINADIAWAVDQKTAEQARHDPLLEVITRAPGITPGTYKPIARDWFGDLKIFTTEQETASRLVIEYVDPEGDVPEVFKSNHIMVCTTGAPDWHQEFAATGGLVLARSIGVHPLWLNNLYSARYHNDEDLGIALAELVQNPDRSQQKAELAGQYVSQNTWDRLLPQVFDQIGDNKLKLLFARLKPLAEDVKFAS